MIKLSGNDRVAPITKFNLQLFAEGEESVNEDLGLETPVEEPVDEPVLEEDVSDQQSKDKDNPANHAFAEMRREKKRLEDEINQYKSRQTETDQYYAELAKKVGRDDIKTEADYRRALAQNDLVERYKDTQDPLALAEIVKQSIMPELTSLIPQQQAQSYDFKDEINDFNSQFGKSIDSIDEVMNLENADKVVSYMDKNGLSLSEAYRLANPDKVEAAIRQKAINQAKGNTHVSDKKQQSDSQGHVSQAELDVFMKRHKISDPVEGRKKLLDIKKLFN